MNQEPSLEAIVYVSASTLPMTAASLEDLLDQARRFNAESGVTGALIYSDGSFMQYFEGPPAAMGPTYDRIRASTRHSRIVEMLNEPIAARWFPSWTMALANPPVSELLAISTATWVVENARVRGRRSNSPGMAMLLNFWDRRRRQD
jgi:hypothetical protein